MKSNHIVIDTNVFISSIIGQNGYPRKIFDEIILTGEVKLCLSQEVFKEYYAVIQREQFQQYKNFVDISLKLLSILKEISVWNAPKEKVTILRDSDDTKFLELAISAEAECVVSGNTNDFTIKEF